MEAANCSGVGRVSSRVRSRSGQKMRMRSGLLERTALSRTSGGRVVSGCTANRSESGPSSTRNCDAPPRELNCGLRNAARRRFSAS
jgi:hypothetical protein